MTYLVAMNALHRTQGINLFHLSQTTVVGVVITLSLLSFVCLATALAAGYKKRQTTAKVLLSASLVLFVGATVFGLVYLGFDMDAIAPVPIGTENSALTSS